MTITFLISLRHLDRQRYHLTILNGNLKCAYLRSGFCRVWSDPIQVLSVRSDLIRVLSVRSDPIRSGPIRLLSTANKIILVWVCTAFMKPGHKCSWASEHVVQHPWELLDFSVRGCLHDTSMIFILVQVHYGSLSFLCTCLRDYIWCVSSAQKWYRIKFSFWYGNPY